MLRSRKSVPVPEVGGKSPGFQLPSAQGGQLQLNMRTARGPVVVVFYRPWSEEDVAYFKALSRKEEEINLAAASVVGIGVAQPDEARNFVRASGIKSYVLYDYAHVASHEWGLLVKDEEHGAYSRPAVFIVSAEREVVHAWVDERPEPADILSKVSEITGLPKPAEEGDEGEEEKPKKKPRRAAKSEESESKSEDAGSEEEPSAEKPSSEKPSSEEREKRHAERKTAREQGEGTGESEKE